MTLGIEIYGFIYLVREEQYGTPQCLIVGNLTGNIRVDLFDNKFQMLGIKVVEKKTNTVVCLHVFDIFGLVVYHLLFIIEYMRTFLTSIIQDCLAQ